MVLQTISINLHSLNLTCEESELSFSPFSVDLSDSLPYCCVVGPSGTGKTTFFKSLIPRFVEDWQNYTSARIDIRITRNGLDFFTTNGRIGYAAQKPFFVAQHTTRESLVKPFDWSGKAKPLENDIDQLIEDFELRNIIDRRTYQLSAGERQCLNLARMFIAGSELAIIDECFSSMDEMLADKIARVIINKYAIDTRILITGHRQIDLKLFKLKTLKFSFSDRTDQAGRKRIREVTASEYNENS